MLNIDLKDKIQKLSAEYWDYKGFYDFPSKYKGDCDYGKVQTHPLLVNQNIKSEGPRQILV